MIVKSIAASCQYTLFLFNNLATEHSGKWLHPCFFFSIISYVFRLEILFCSCFLNCLFCYFCYFSCFTGEKKKDCLNSSCDDFFGTITSKRQKKEVENICDTQTRTHVSMNASGNSPSCSCDQKSLIQKQSSRRSLGKKRILQNTLHDNLFLEIKDLEKFSEQNHKDESTMTTSVANKTYLLQVKDLVHITSSPKTAELITVNSALNDSLSNSLVSREELNTHSFDRRFPFGGSDSLTEHRKRNQLQTLSSFKLNASGSEKEFLHWVTTDSKDLCTVEASYEDFFFSPDLNKVQPQRLK